MDAAHSPETMLEELAVKRVIEQYCRHLDDRRIPALIELFAEDAIFFTMGKELRGRGAIAEFFRAGESETLDRPTSTHVLSACLVDIGDATAHAETDWVLIRRREDGAFAIELAGRYRDELRRVAGVWKFSLRKAVMLAREKTKGLGPE